jgi:hypothetical protein
MKIQLTATFIYEGCDSSEHAKELLNADLESIAFPCYSASFVNPKPVVLKL